MPELPEVETVVRDLRPLLAGRTIHLLKVSETPLRRPWNADWNAELNGLRVRELRRRGKWIDIALAKDRHLLFHLGMTGQLRIVPAHQPRADHTHLQFRLNRGRKELRYRDVRRFGSATFLTSTAELDNFFAESGLGPEPFDLPVEYFRKKLANTSRCLKAILLDQRVVAGVGNIYADEALFTARLHPARLGRRTTTAQTERLRDAIELVLRRAIEYRGSSIRDYLGGSGQKGRYQEEFQVYGRANLPCRRCNAAIIRMRLAGRSTHFCGHCQAMRNRKKTTAQDCGVQA